MLAVTSYSKPYIDQCRANLERQLVAYEALLDTARLQKGSEPVIAGFEASYCSAMVLVLDRHFLHRGRAQEGKDGNPLNEVRMLCAAITDYSGVMSKDNTIKYDPAKSIAGIAVGQSVVLDLPTLKRLIEAFLAEIGKRFA
jgi:hypothetical protein